MALDIPKYQELFKQRDVRVQKTDIVDTTTTKFLSFSGANFQGANPDTDLFHWDTDGYLSDAADQVMYGDINLPHGSVIVAAIVWQGAGGNIQWALKRTDREGNVDTMASATGGVEDTSISNPIVDNNNYSYFIQLWDMDANDTVSGGSISYREG